MKDNLISFVDVIVIFCSTKDFNLPRTAQVEKVVAPSYTQCAARSPEDDCARAIHDEILIETILPNYALVSKSRFTRLDTLLATEGRR